MPGPVDRVSLPAVVLGGLLIVAGCGTGTPEQPAGTDVYTYVGGAACASCHEEATAAWHRSDHDLAMEPATPETVLGDFDDAKFVHPHGDTTRFFRRGDDFFYVSEGPTGRIDTFEVRYTFGYRPLQQYLLPIGDGRLQSHTVAWDTERKRWFSLYPDEDIPADDWLHWTGGAMNWNYMCADCHSTNLRKNFDLATNTYHTTYSEVDVSCEACHGPGSAHVAWAEAVERGEAPEEAATRGLTADLAVQAQQIDACAPCHSRRRPIAEGFTPGDDFLDYYGPELLEEGLYFPDGQILDEVYVYASFLQSKMHGAGVRCTDCHDAHSTRIKLEGNALCAQCHAPALYDVPEHLGLHESGTPGGECVDCHMPERTYMVVDPRRDHSFKVPRPELTAELGVPNACNGCHADRSPAWAQEYVDAWYGPDPPSTFRFARTFAAAREARPEAGGDLAALALDEALPAMVRATAVEMLGQYDAPAARQAARDALEADSPLVRAAAVRALEAREAPREVASLVRPLLDDPARLVRIEAARALALARRHPPRLRLDEAQRAAYESALAEYLTAERVASDQPGSHVNLAVVHEALGEDAEAERAYHTAVRLDSTFVPAHLNLAMLYDRRRTAAAQAGRTGVADSLRGASEERLRSVIRHQPALPDPHYMLGLLLAEQADRLPEAAEYLAEAARLAPDRPRVQYNAGLAHQHLGRHGAAERYLLAAHRLAPEQPDFLNALSIFYVQREHWAEAQRYTERLAALAPGAPAVEQRLRLIRERTGT